MNKSGAKLNNIYSFLHSTSSLVLCGGSVQCCVQRGFVIKGGQPRYGGNTSYPAVQLYWVITVMCAEHSVCSPHSEKIDRVAAHWA